MKGYSTGNNGAFNFYINQFIVNRTNYESSLAHIQFSLIYAVIVINVL